MRRLILLFLDLFSVALAAVIALLLRDNLEISRERIENLGAYIGFAILTAAIVLPLAGTNRGFWRYSSFSDALRILAGATLVVVGAVALTFAHDRLAGVARAVPLLHLMLIVILMTGLRVAIRLRHVWRTRMPAVAALAPSSETVVVVGQNEIAELFLRSARKFASGSVHVAGVIGFDVPFHGRVLHGAPVLGSLDEMPEILRRLEIHGVFVNRIVVTVQASELSQAARNGLAVIENGSGIAIDYFAERIGFALPTGRPFMRRFPPGSACGLRGSTLPSLRDIAAEGVLVRPFWRAKRILDFVLALVAIVAAAPLMIFTAALVAVDVGVPVLFWQERPGAFGRRFHLYKFRTMRGAHDEFGRRVPDAARLSRIGEFLRRSRLDELPQLFSILTGEMSFVGPRPLLPVDQAPEHDARLSVRPGLTGWAQVHGGRDIDAADKAAMDVWYVRNASFVLDFKIALKTAHMLLAGDKTNSEAIAQAWQDAEVRVPASSTPAHWHRAHELLFEEGARGAA